MLAPIIFLLSLLCLNLCIILIKFLWFTFKSNKCEYDFVLTH